MPTIVSSYNPTLAGSVDARTADTLTYSFVARPQAMSVYVRFQNRGVIQISNGRVFQIGGSNADSIRLIGNVTSLIFIKTASDGSTQVTSTATPSVIAIGTIIEALCTLTAAGVIQLITSSNSAALVTGTASSAQRLPPAWGALTLGIGNTAAGAGQGAMALLNFLIHRGVQDMATMRRIAGVGAR